MYVYALILSANNTGVYMSMNRMMMTEKYNEIVTESSSNKVKWICSIYLITVIQNKHLLQNSRESTERCLVNTYITNSVL